MSESRAMIVRAGGDPSRLIVVSRSTRQVVSSGIPGAGGADGRSITSVDIDGSNHIIITYSDATTSDAGLLPGSASWGGITGTLSTQTDLQSALDGKATSAQGTLAASAVQPGDLSTVATSGDYDDLTNKPTLGTAADTAATDYATAAQGALADSAVQPGDLSTVATSGAYADLSGKPDLSEKEQVLTAGANVTIDRTDPDHPVISSTASGGGGGDVVGPASATANAVALYNGTTGKLIKDGPVLGTAAEASTGDFTPAAHVGSSGSAHADVVAGGASGFMTGAQATKVAGIATGATANDTDANLKNRANHTGTQAQSTVTNLTTDLAAKQATLVSGTNIKTVNGSTLLGSGDLVVSGGTSLAVVTPYAGTSKTLGLADINTIVDCTSASAVTITIPPQATIAWTADAEIHIRMSGTGVVSIAAGAGVTFPPLTTPVAMAGQGAIVTLMRRSSDVWAVVGGIAGAADVAGPASAVDNEIARFDGATGKLLKAGLKYQTSATDTTAGALVIQGGTNLAALDTVAIGYGTGSGGTVAQATSKATTVTLNKPSGRITMDAAALAAGASVAFQLNNTAIAATDVLLLTRGSANSNAYEIICNSVGTGVARISVKNTTGGSLAEAILINFVVIKGAAA